MTVSTLKIVVPDTSNFSILDKLKISAKEEIDKLKLQLEAEVKSAMHEKMASLQTRAKTAMSKVAESCGVEHHASLVAMLIKAHQQAEVAIQGDGQRMPGEVPWELVHGLSHLGLLNGSNPLPKTPAEFQTVVRTDGTLLGCRQWELLDPRWLEAMVEWLEHLNWRAPFGCNPALLDMPDDVVLGIVGDWGTGLFEPNSAAGKIAQLVGTLKPDYTIHLGDVYYAGTEKDEEENMKAWPQGTRGSFTLNSNHEMYNGAFGYFAELGRNFPLQNGTSYFALQNSHWLVIGLDSVYHSDSFNLYMDGKLNQGQLDWLASLPKGKRVLVLSHHEGYSAQGKDKTALYQQVTQALNREPDYWYWGHLHNGLVYQAVGGFHGRCAGHGAVPYGNASEMNDDPAVLWSETESAKDDNYPERVLNGFAVITLSGNGLSEKMMGEDGSVRWEASSR